MLMKGTRRPGPRCRPRAPNPGRAAEDARGDAHGLSAGTGRQRAREGAGPDPRVQTAP